MKLSTFQRIALGSMILAIFVGFSQGSKLGLFLLNQPLDAAIYAGIGVLMLIFCLGVAAVGYVVHLYHKLGGRNEKKRSGGGSGS